MYEDPTWQATNVGLRAVIKEYILDYSAGNYLAYSKARHSDSLISYSPLNLWKCAPTNTDSNYNCNYCIITQEFLIVGCTFGYFWKRLNSLLRDLILHYHHLLLHTVPGEFIHRRFMLTYV